MFLCRNHRSIELVKQTGAEIRDNGFTQDVYVAPYKGDRVCAISYTFDDGLQEHYTLLFPKLEKYGFKGTSGYGVNV